MLDSMLGVGMLYEEIEKRITNYICRSVDDVATSNPALVKKLVKYLSFRENNC